MVSTKVVYLVSLLGLFTGFKAVRASPAEDDTPAQTASECGPDPDVPGVWNLVHDKRDDPGKYTSDLLDSLWTQVGDCVNTYSINEVNPELWPRSTLRCYSVASSIGPALQILAFETCMKASITPAGTPITQEEFQQQIYIECPVTGSAWAFANDKTWDPTQFTSKMVNKAWDVFNALFVCQVQGLTETSMYSSSINTCWTKLGSTDTWTSLQGAVTQFVTCLTDVYGTSGST